MPSPNSGSYAVVLRLRRDKRIRIGSLGMKPFRKGIYVYVGSGMGCLFQRIHRHMRPAEGKRMHWHIDYLLSDPGASVLGILYRISGTREECDIAGAFSKGSVSVPEFGCSDCNCPSHLFLVNKLPECGMKQFHECSHGFTEARKPRTRICPSH